MTAQNINLEESRNVTSFRAIKENAASKRKSGSVKVPLHASY